MTWCPEVFQQGLTLTVCGADLAGHDGPCRLGDVEWCPTRGKVKRTVDGDVVGAPPRRPVAPPRAPHTSAAIVGAFDGPGQARTDDPDETRPGTAGAQRVVRRITAAGVAAAEWLT